MCIHAKSVLCLYCKSVMKCVVVHIEYFPFLSYPNIVLALFYWPEYFVSFVDCIESIYYTDWCYQINKLPYKAHAFSIFNPVVMQWSCRPVMFWPLSCLYRACCPQRRNWRTCSHTPVEYDDIQTVTKTLVSFTFLSESGMRVPWKEMMRTPLREWRY